MAEIGCQTHKINKLVIITDPIIGAKNDQMEIPVAFAAAISKLLFNLVKVKIEPNRNTKGKNEKTRKGILYTAILRSSKTRISLPCTFRTNSSNSKIKAKKQKAAKT